MHIYNANQRKASSLENDSVSKLLPSRSSTSSFTSSERSNFDSLNEAQTELEEEDSQEEQVTEA